MGKNIVGIFENSYKQIIDILNNFEEIKNVYLFGSRANNTYKNGSDIDLFILIKFYVESLKNVLKKCPLLFFKT